MNSHGPVTWVYSVSIAQAGLYRRGELVYRSSQRWLTVLALLLFLSVESASGAATESLRGRVVFERAPVAGAIVYAYRSAAGGLRGEGDGRSRPTGEDGVFSLTLDPGEYYLVARKGGASTAGGDAVPEYFGFHRSPVPTGVDVADGYLVQVVRRHPTAEIKSTSEAGGIRGRILGPSGPVARATIAFFTDPATGFRGPAAFAAESGEDGGFSIDLPENTYYVLASWKQSGGFRGPPREGDLYGFFDGNPLEVRPGIFLSIDLQMIEKLDAAKVSPFRDAAAATGIRGVVRTASGEIPIGSFVYTATDPGRLLGGVPLHRSTIDSKGGFFLGVGPGVYYLVVRSTLGGPPQPGEWFGTYGSASPAPVTVEGSVVGGVVITVDRLRGNPPASSPLLPPQGAGGPLR